MHKAFQKIELAANVLIIVVALLLGGAIIQKFFFAAPTAAIPKRPPRLEPRIGSTVNLPDVNWSRQPKTLILVLQSGCRFCNESAPFYKSVIEAARNKNIKLIAVLPTGVDESIEHLNKLGLTNIEVKQSSLDSLQVSGTPTLILTNDKGEVTNYWVGKLPPNKEMDVISKLNS